MGYLSFFLVLTVLACIFGYLSNWAGKRADKLRDKRTQNDRPLCFRIEVIPEGRRFPISVRTYPHIELHRAIEYLEIWKGRIDK